MRRVALRAPRSGHRDGGSARWAPAQHDAAPAPIVPHRPNLDPGELALYELPVPDGARLRSAARWELFLFPAVRDVLAGRDPDRVLVVHYGPPQPAAWIGALRNAGFDTRPNRRGAGQSNPPAPLDPRHR
jgi:hypothetical protein